MNDVVENGKDRDPEYPHFCVKAGDEVIAVVIRDADSFEQNAQDGVANWLDERRSKLQNPVENLINALSISCLPESLTESPDSIFVSGNTVLAAKSV